MEGIRPTEVSHLCDLLRRFDEYRPVIYDCQWPRYEGMVASHVEINEEGDQVMIGTKWLEADGRRFGTGRVERHGVVDHLPGGFYPLEFFARNNERRTDDDESRPRETVSQVHVGMDASGYHSIQDTTTTVDDEFVYEVIPTDVEQIVVVTHSSVPYKVLLRECECPEYCNMRAEIREIAMSSV